MAGGPVGETSIHTLEIPENAVEWSSALSNGSFQISTLKDPINGFWVSPPAAGVVCELRRDELGRPFVRLSATKSGPYLALSSAIPSGLPIGEPLRIRAEVRLHRAGPVQIQVNIALRRTRKSSIWRGMLGYGSRLNAKPA